MVYGGCTAKMKIQHILVGFLFIEAVVVLLGLLLDRSVWGVIALYWVTLSIKNFLDLKEMIKR